MKKLFILITILTLIVPLSAQTYIVSGGIGTPYLYKEKGEGNLTGTGLEEVYLLNTFTGATIKYSSSAIMVKFYKYKQSLADKVQIPDSDISITSISGNSTYTISNLEDGFGYLAEENGNAKSAVWIIDYSKHRPTLNSIEAKEGEGEYKCTSFKLYITKTEDNLAFYTTSGSRREILRKYTIEYDILEWSQKDEAFQKSTKTIGPKTIGTDEPIDNVPLRNTAFKLTGDQFAKHFGKAEEKTSAEYKAVAVEGHIVAKQEGKDNDDESTETTLGGSAPAIIDFYGRANEDVAYFYTWTIYNKEDMENFVARYTDKDIKYTFDRKGRFVVQLEVADQDSECIMTTSTEVNIEDSFLDASNYFSPGGATESEFKFVYKSILKFKCTIFNRWEVKVYQWNDPAKGWDGRHNGKFVSTGVYYYVAEYTDSNGKRRTKSGDINVLRKH